MALQRPSLVWVVFLIKSLLLLKCNKNMSSIFVISVMRNGTRTTVALLPLTFYFSYRKTMLWSFHFLKLKRSLRSLLLVLRKHQCQLPRLILLTPHHPLFGNIKESPIKVLLDGASTHNFMHPRAANFLKLPIETSSQFSVLEGSGHTRRCLGVVPQVSLTIQGFTLCTNFLIVEFHRSDMVLGIVWLHTLGPWGYSSTSSFQL